MSKITINMVVSAKQNSVSVDITPEDLGITIEEWLSLSKEKQDEIVQTIMDGENDQNRPYWRLTDYDIED